VGIDSFEKLRTGNYLYVDKTRYIAKMNEMGLNYVFLSRPRRFGKSLFVSTLEQYFLGNKKLFDGLYIARHEPDEWESYPVIRINWASKGYYTVEKLRNKMNLMLQEYEKKWGANSEEKDLSDRFDGVIKRAHEENGKPVVILIDEYDKPMLDSLRTKDFDAIKEEMTSFYLPIKVNSDIERFVFLTGISQFSKLNIFSVLNNLTNITAAEDFSALCGITHNELKGECFLPHIDKLAVKNEMSRDEAYSELARQYDGYHFSSDLNQGVFNPFSLLNSLLFTNFDSYWFESGTPSYLTKMLDNLHFSLNDLDNWFSSQMLAMPISESREAIPLLYQSGYLTIKNWNRRDNSYLLEIPNQEVRVGLMDTLLPVYLGPECSVTSLSRANNNLFKSLDSEHNVDKAMNILTKIFAAIPPSTKKDTEKLESYYQKILWMLFSYKSRQVGFEEAAGQGRLDLVLDTQDRFYIFELKINTIDNADDMEADEKMASEALNQIDLKRYADRYALYSKPVVKLGVVFSAKARTITAWKQG
jgi:hypothetical protein